MTQKGEHKYLLYKQISYDNIHNTINLKQKFLNGAKIDSLY